MEPALQSCFRLRVNWGEAMKLLIVDDSKVIRHMAEDVLNENDIDVEVFMATSGKEALELLQETDVDVMLLDIIMPELTGLDVLVELKRLGYSSHLKIIMFTSLSDKSYMRDCFQLGASDYIGKPIDPDEFVARVQNALHQLKLEKELSESIHTMKSQNEELKALNERIQETQIQLVQKEQMASMGHLAAGVAHEINNPLGFVISNFNVIKDYFSSYEEYIEELESIYELASAFVPESSQIIEKFNNLKLKSDLDFIREDLEDLYRDTDDGLDRVRTIVDGLRFFSRIDQMEAYEEYNLNDGIENLIVLTKNEMKFVADLELNLDRTIPNVRAIGYQVNQTLLNILMNALDSIKKSEKGQRGIVEIKTFKNDSYIGCTIRDNGVGIEDKVIHDIFKPFYTSKEIGSGVGLGLSISYDIIVNKHGGMLDVQTRVGEYAEFSIYLPIISTNFT